MRRLFLALTVVLLTPSIVRADTIANSVECSFARPDDRSNCQARIIYSTQSGDLGYSLSTGLRRSTSPANGSINSIPIGASIKWGKDTAITTEVGADLVEGNLYPSGRIELRQKLGNTTAIGSIGTHLEDSNADTIATGLRTTQLQLELQQSLSKTTKASLRYNKDWLNDGNQIDGYTGSIAHKITPATELKATVYHRSADRVDSRLWTPDSATQATLEIQQGITFSPTLSGRIGARVGVGVGDEVSPLAGFGFGLRGKLSQKWSIDGFGTVGYGVKAGATLRGSW